MNFESQSFVMFCYCSLTSNVYPDVFSNIESMGAVRGGFLPLLMLKNHHSKLLNTQYIAKISNKTLQGFDFQNLLLRFQT